MAIGSFKLPNTAASAPTPVTDPSGWVRPYDWLAMPTIGTQEFIGLLSITDDESNHIALTCQGSYTVDWGDGVTENVATNVKAQHSYTYSAISSGTLSARGYKQVLVRVTPQAGQNLTKVDIQQQNSILAKLHNVGWLDIAVKGSNITTLSLGGNTVYQGMCENVDIYSFGAITNLQYLFNNFLNLRKLTLPSTSSVTSFLGMFASCSAITTIPLFNTSSGTNFSFMFQNCNNLQTIPLLNTSSGTNFSSMTQNCISLQLLPNLNTALGTNFTSMVSGSTSLAKGAFQGTRYAISYSGFCLSQSAIVDIFNGLGTAVGTPTVNVSSNPGRAALTAGEILIATAKGWIVV